METLGAQRSSEFASNAPKWEISFADAINNEIVIPFSASCCRVYDCSLIVDERGGFTALGRYGSAVKSMSMLSPQFERASA